MPIGCNLVDRFCWFVLSVLLQRLFITISGCAEESKYSVSTEGAVLRRETSVRLQ